jgi:hypothetical protein
MRMLYEYTAKNTKDKCELDQLIDHGSTPGHGKRYALSKGPTKFSEQSWYVYVVHN